MEAKPPPPDPSDPPAQNNSSLSAGRDPDVLQLLAEDAVIERETVETGKVRVATVTHTRDHLVDELLARTNVEVKRVPIGRVIDAIPPVKEEAGGLTIIPIVEETLVVERRLVLKEEVHVQRVQTTERYQQTVQLRHQTAEISRIPAGQSDPARGAGAGSVTESKPEDT